VPWLRQLHGILGGVLILAVAGFYAILLPRVEIGADDQVVAAGETAVVEGFLMTFPSGWKRNDGEIPVTYTKGGASIQVIFPSSSNDPTGAILGDDSGEHWVVGPIQQLTTDSEGGVISVEGRSPIQVRRVWVVEHDDEVVTVVGMAPESVWPLMSEEIGGMALSTRSTGAG
jgi:hypothetical protein